MAGLNVSIAFFSSVVAICEVTRWFSKRIFPPKVYLCLARELASSFQMCACCLELKMLVMIGPWGGGFGPDVNLTLLFVIFLVHGASFDGASANPALSLQEFLMLDSSFVVTIAQLLSQFMGMGAAWSVTKQYWSWELTDLHMIQNLIAQDCSSSLRTSVLQGIFVEATCSFFFQLVVLRFKASYPMYRIPITALAVTILTYTAFTGIIFHVLSKSSPMPVHVFLPNHLELTDSIIYLAVGQLLFLLLSHLEGNISGWILFSKQAAAPFTEAFFNPTLASAVTFPCSGNSLLEYMQVYWLGPITGMLIALFVYQGNIPRLFQRNLIYGQKNKYRTPKGKVLPPSGTQWRQAKTEKTGCLASTERTD